jgi:SAM-dependent methyltransferase
MKKEWLEANRRSWDERVPIHVESQFYDVDAFRNGRCPLRAFEIEDLGDVSGRSLLHLQCHFGLDTLGWARRGATVTGLDFSQPAVEAARALATESNLAAEFVTGDVYDAATLIDRTFDIVYTGLGALCWLGDLDRWAAVVADLTRPGGRFYVAEFHPLTDILGEDAVTVEHPYFGGTTPQEWNEAGTYADPDAATKHNRTYEWVHPLSAVLDSLVRRGFALERIREMDYTIFRRWPFLVERADGTWVLPDSKPRLPLMYAARFRRDSP